VCAKCGAGPEAIDEDGFCSACGFRRLAPLRDHFERAISAEFAGITDKGLRHHRNEDFFAMDVVGDARVIVVCDGVSSTSEADRASETAVDAVFRALAQGDSLTEAVGRGQIAVAGLDGKDAATTVVAAVVRGRRAEIAWVGDSRAYWISQEDSRQLTRDDSWLNEVVESGEMAEVEAAVSPQAHAITRWLGADAAEEESAPSIVEFEAPGKGFLLVCSDGLWNYVPDAAGMAELIYAHDGEEAVAVVRSLADFANGRGGQDNITAVLVKVDCGPTAGEETRLKGACPAETKGDGDAAVAACPDGGV
jgi:serine/threonine protein phosphatase PrpC